MPTMRTAEVNMVQNDEALEINLDLLEERREQAEIHEAKSKAKMEKYYNSKVRNTSFKPGNLVYRSNEANHVKESRKLSPKWEGPYEVTEALGNGAYKLKDYNGKLLSRTWNVRTDVQEKDEKQSQNDKTRHGMKKRRKDTVKSKPKCRKVNPSQPRQTRSQKSRKTSLGTKLVKSLNLFKEEKEENKEKGQNCQFGKVKPQGAKLPSPQNHIPQGLVV
ncbi:hypothetical protein Tco_1438283 [Tanacetum coccineum]